MAVSIASTLIAYAAIYRIRPFRERHRMISAVEDPMNPELIFPDGDSKRKAVD
jgi:hypothetical protein